jgi:uncharacterized membrane protein YgdD (TMEM256/DUF423 family)
MTGIGAPIASKIWIITGAASAGLAVVFGAFGAHALKDHLSEKMLAVYQTGSQYQFIHALALILLGLWASTHESSLGSAAGWCFALGTVLFSGSLYALAITDVRVLGAITPFGGLSFIGGWICFAAAAWKATS